MDGTGIHEHGYWLQEHEHNYDPQLAGRLSGLFQGFSVADFGCGDGSYVKFLRDANIQAFGFDGNPVTQSLGPTFYVLDLAVPFFLPAIFDWILCLEVGEHIPKSCEDVFFNNLRYHAKVGVVLSWAVPGQLGHGHVNCQPNEYVIDKMSARAFKFNGSMAQRFRNSATIAYFRNTLMVFQSES